MGQKISGPTPAADSERKSLSNAQDSTAENRQPDHDLLVWEAYAFGMVETSDVSEKSRNQLSQDIRDFLAEARAGGSIGRLSELARVSQYHAASLASQGRKEEYGALVGAFESLADGLWGASTVSEGARRAITNIEINQHENQVAMEHLVEAHVDVEATEPITTEGHGSEISYSGEAPSIKKTLSNGQNSPQKNGEKVNSGTTESSKPSASGSSRAVGDVMRSVLVAGVSAPAVAAAPEEAAVADASIAVPILEDLGSSSSQGPKEESSNNVQQERGREVEPTTGPEVAPVHSSESPAVDAWNERAAGRGRLHDNANPASVPQALAAPKNEVASEIERRFVGVFSNLDAGSTLGSRLSRLGAEMAEDGNFLRTDLERLGKQIEDNISLFRAVSTSPNAASGAPRFIVDMMLEGINAAAGTFRTIRTVWEESAEGWRLLTFMQKNLNPMLAIGSGPLPAALGGAL